MPYKTRKPKKDTPPPETEIRLRELQDQFLKDKSNSQVRDEFFLMLRDYARSLTLQRIKRSAIFLPPERVDEICTDATIDLMEQYSKEGWCVDASFAGLLFWKVNRAMYDQKEEEQNSSLNITFDDSDNGKEIIDLVSYSPTLGWNSTVLSYDDTINVVDDDFLSKVNVSFNEVSSVVDEAFDILPYRVFMRFVPWLVLQFRKPKTRNIQSLFFKVYLTNKEENAFDILLLEIYNRISKESS